LVFGQPSPSLRFPTTGFIVQEEEEEEAQIEYLITL